MTCEYWQTYGMTALLWASYWGKADTARVLVENGASVEAVDKVNIHVHALANTCCIKDVSVLVRITMMMMSDACVHRYLYVCIYIHIHMRICMYTYI